MAVANCDHLFILSHTILNHFKWIGTGTEKLESWMASQGL